MIQKVSIIQTPDRIIQQLQSNIATPVNQLVSNPLADGQLLPGIVLQTGSNTINHKLGRPLIGWFVSRLRSPGATIYDTQDTNPLPAQTLLLTSSAAVTVDLYVF